MAILVPRGGGEVGTEIVRGMNQRKRLRMRRKNRLRIKGEEGKEK